MGLVICNYFNVSMLLIFFKCSNMAREGLRTLVVAKKVLTTEQYTDFQVRKERQQKKRKEKEEKL